MTQFVRALTARYVCSPRRRGRLLVVNTELVELELALCFQMSSSVRFVVEGGTNSQGLAGRRKSSVSEVQGHNPG